MALKVGFIGLRIMGSPMAAHLRAHGYDLENRRDVMRRLPGWGAVLLLILTAATARAQSTTGTIGGRIADAQGLSIPGVTVTVTGPQGAKTAVTDTDGRFNVPFLTPSPYAVHAELQGFKAIDRSDVQVRLGQTSDIPLTLEVGGLTESVTVVGAPTTVDASSTLYLVPGVSSSGSLGAGNPSVSGSSGLENQYVVDGVNITNGGYGALGSYSIVFGSLGNDTSYDFMQEVQVKTGGYEAEFGQSTGGVINVVTKSGTNELSGSVFGYSRPNSFENAWRQAQTVNGTVNTTKNWFETTFGSVNPDYGVAGASSVVAGQQFLPPRQLRVGARVEF